VVRHFRQPWVLIPGKSACILIMTHINANNPQGMQLGTFTYRTPARFEYIYCTLFPLWHSNEDMYLFLKDASFCPFFVLCMHVSIPKRRIFLPLFLSCAYDSSVLQNFKIFTQLLPNFSYWTL
jgi:hypothetical protein